MPTITLGDALKFAVLVLLCAALAASLALIINGLISLTATAIEAGLSLDWTGYTERGANMKPTLYINQIFMEPLRANLWPDFWDFLQVIPATVVAYMTFNLLRKVVAGV